MSKKMQFLTGGLSVAEHLRVDAELGNLRINDIPSFPPGIIPRGYLDKCSSVEVTVRASGNFDYLAAMPIRPDKQKIGSAKNTDIDPVVFCCKRDDLEAFSTSVALPHQAFLLRTTPLQGYEVFTVGQTVTDLREKLVAGYQPIAARPYTFGKEISYSVGKLDQLVGSNIKVWLNASSPKSRGSNTPLTTQGNESTQTNL